MTQHLWTREHFERFVAGAGHGAGPVRILVRPPYSVEPCDCGDEVCHGWRLVERGDSTGRLSIPKDTQ